MPNQTRINKLISQSGVASRREAEKLILEGKVIVNGKKATLGQKINDNDQVFVNGNLIQKIQEHKYYLLNKPKKTLCTLKDNFNRKLVTELIDDDTYLFPVGRLDYDTTGVLFITNDGELSNKLTHPSNLIKRVYRARINEPLNYSELKFLNSNNVLINGKKSQQLVEQVEKKSYFITLHQGTYHHIKKLFELVDKKVLDLKRIEFATITCEKLQVGEYRRLKPNEIRRIKSLVGLI